MEGYTKIRHPQFDLGLFNNRSRIRTSFEGTRRTVGGILGGAFEEVIVWMLSVEWEDNYHGTEYNETYIFARHRRGRKHEAYTSVSVHGVGRPRGELYCM
jgi:hypothetical protein